MEWHDGVTGWPLDIANNIGLNAVLSAAVDMKLTDLDPRWVDAGRKRYYDA